MFEGITGTQGNVLQVENFEGHIEILRCQFLNNSPLANAPENVGLNHVSNAGAIWIRARASVFIGETIFTGNTCACYDQYMGPALDEASGGLPGTQPGTLNEVGVGSGAILWCEQFDSGSICRVYSNEGANEAQPIQSAPRLAGR